MSRVAGADTIHFRRDICAAQESDVSLDLAGLSSFLSRLADSFATADPQSPCHQCWPADHIDHVGRQ